MLGQLRVVIQVRLDVAPTSSPPRPLPAPPSRPVGPPFVVRRLGRLWGGVGLRWFRRLGGGLGYLFGFCLRGMGTLVDGVDELDQQFADLGSLRGWGGGGRGGPNGRVAELHVLSGGRGTSSCMKREGFLSRSPLRSDMVPGAPSVIQ